VLTEVPPLIREAAAMMKRLRNSTAGTKQVLCRADSDMGRPAIFFRPVFSTDEGVLYRRGGLRGTDESGHALAAGNSSSLRKAIVGEHGDRWTTPVLTFFSVLKLADYGDKPGHSLWFLFCQSRNRCSPRLAVRIWYRIWVRVV